MKKIVLCGATQGSNFGDTIFAYMFYHYCVERFPTTKFKFTKVSKYTQTYLNVPEADKKFLREADGLIFMSGGFFGEAHHENLRGALQRYIKYFRYGKFFMHRKKPIAISGVGAGPLTPKLLRKLAVAIFNYATVASVRDEESKTFLVDSGVTKPVMVTSDSAQVIQDPVFQVHLKTLAANLPLSTSKKNVLIHVSEAIDFSLYQQKVLVPIAQTLPHNIRVIITNDVFNTAELLKATAACFADFECVTYAYTDPFKFLALLANVDSIITPKLHVGILGATFKKPVISFPLHPEKTLRYYRQIGYPENSKSLFELDEYAVKRMINKLLWVPLVVDDTLLTLARSNFEMLNEFILNIKEGRSK